MNIEVTTRVIIKRNSANNLRGTRLYRLVLAAAENRKRCKLLGGGCRIEGTTDNTGLRDGERDKGPDKSTVLVSARHSVPDKM
jgi:hypothetical protein